MPLINEIDKQIYIREIAPYLPSRIFDAHTHLFQSRFRRQIEMPPGLPAKDVDLKEMQNWWQQLFPQQNVHGLLMPFPTVDMDWQAENEFTAAEICDNNNRFSILTLPSQSSAELEADIQKYKPAGLKPYLCFANMPDPQQAEITGFIPEHQIALANKYKLAITLHVSKPRGMADENNLTTITRLVAEYPDCNFILAHCGRCFIPVNAEDMLAKLPVAQNLWIDTSAVCDIGVFLHLFKKYDINRICFGTDLVSAAGFRGQYVRMGMAWDMVAAEQMARPGGQKLNATYCAYENLRSTLIAAKFLNLNQSDLQKIFYDNAAELFNLPKG